MREITPDFSTSEILRSLNQYAITATDPHFGEDHEIIKRINHFLMQTSVREFYPLFFDLVENSKDIVTGSLSEHLESLNMIQMVHKSDTGHAVCCSSDAQFPLFGDDGEVGNDLQACFKEMHHHFSQLNITPHFSLPGFSKVVTQLHTESGPIEHLKRLANGLNTSAHAAQMNHLIPLVKDLLTSFQPVLTSWKNILCFDTMPAEDPTLALELVHLLNTIISFLDRLNAIVSHAPYPVSNINTAYLEIKLTLSSGMKPLFNFFEQHADLAQFSEEQINALFQQLRLSVENTVGLCLTVTRFNAKHCQVINALLDLITVYQFQHPQMARPQSKTQCGTLVKTLREHLPRAVRRGGISFTLNDEACLLYRQLLSRLESFEDEYDLHHTPSLGYNAPGVLEEGSIEPLTRIPQCFDRRNFARYRRSPLIPAAVLREKPDNRFKEVSLAEYLGQQHHRATQSEATSPLVLSTPPGSHANSDEEDRIIAECMEIVKTGDDEQLRIFMDLQ